MNTTIKIIRGAVVVNIVLLGLAACSSTPAPWTQENSSPWGAKRAAESQSLPTDDSITSSTDEQVIVDEPAPPAEPVAAQKPVAETVVIAPVVVIEDVALTAEEELLAMPGSNYAVQVYASNKLPSLDKFKADKDLYNLMTLKTNRSGSVVYVLVDIYPDKTTANAAAIDLETIIGSKPWVRSVSGLQKIVAQ